ncbi:hypothetical protein FAVG1_13085 [Fusarium avenaceum]|nr:hypothetical protein FAVG1_13085 [Fusarium avenaceum]
MDDNIIDTSIFSLDLSFDQYIQDFAFSQPPTAGSETGGKCELTEYDSVFNSNGLRVSVRSGTKHNFSNVLGVDANESAIVRTTEWSLQGLRSSVKTDIQSPHMKAALKAVVPEYKKRNFRFSHISWSGEPHHLFHYLDRLFEHGKQLALDSDEQRHVSLLVKFLQQELADAVAIFTSQIVLQPSSPSIDFKHVWTIFKLGDLVYLPANIAPKGVEMVVRYNSIRPTCSCSDSIHVFSHSWEFTGQFMNTEPDGFGLNSHTARLFYFQDVREIKLLPFLPLHFHPQRESIRARLISRGRKFHQLQGLHHKFYQGLAWLGRGDVEHETTLGGLEEEDESIIPSSSVFTDEDYLICHSHIGGYAFNERHWGYFDINCVQEIDFDTTTFESSLMVPKKHKNVLLSLVKLQTDNSNQAFSDIIKGKGKGLVFLLHGEPGVGKTMTAADHCKRPLLKIDARSLENDRGSTEGALGKLLRLAERWNAIALLDEADIFLEKRSTYYGARNSLVTAFLRILEYFQGVLFLTTNRIQSFDSAFKSRIQVAIHYPKLDVASRQHLWQIFLARASATIQDLDSWADLAGSVAHEELNGRQIRDIVRIAHASAFGFDITRNHLTDAIDALRTFDMEFEKENKETEDLAEHRPSKRPRTLSEDSDMDESD